MTKEYTPLDDLATIGPAELGKLLGRSTKTIKMDVTRRPRTLPPRFQPPGTRAVIWRVVDVRRWMQALADEHERQRVEALRFAQQHGIKDAPTRRQLGHLGKKSNGLAATDALAKETETT
jgi:hypothetical protein